MRLISSIGARLLPPLTAATPHATTALRVVLCVAAIFQGALAAGTLVGPARAALLGLLVTGAALLGAAVHGTMSRQHSRRLQPVVPMPVRADGAGSAAADGLVQVGDPLTGVLSRTGLIGALNASPQAGLLVAVDVNGLGDFNCREGRQAGDALLRQVADELARSLRPCDLLARWGGDEFVICLAGLDRAAGEVVAGRLNEALRTGLPAYGPHAAVSVTFGFAPFSGKAGPALSTAVREAEEEIHTAKQVRQRRVA